MEGAPASGEFEVQFGGFDRLMPFRLREILLVASPYDAFIISEDDKLTELIFSEYLDLYHLERYRHRLSIEGKPLYYFAIAGRKNANISPEFLSQFGY